MNTPRKRSQAHASAGTPGRTALFAAALVGTAAAVGLALSSLGAPVLVGYLVLLVVGAAALVRKARADRPAEGRTCTCCTSTVHDPVEVR